MNRINGITNRNAGKQTSNQTKLRMHNITAKAALKFGSKTRVLNKRERLEEAHMRFLRELLGYTKLGHQ
jgi:hypothetical protein